MIAVSDTPEADRLAGAPHPRETFGLVGHVAAEQALLDAYRSGRMHHAWILSGPEGIGKATLAYRFARFLIANPDPASPSVATAQDLAVAPDDPTSRHIAQMAHSDLLVLRRAWSPERKTIGREIRVDDVRRLAGFFGSTAGQGGWRVCIIDTADDLNINGANALLKVLEEPPLRSLFLLLSCAPQRLLPTIRSRCRTLSMESLSESEVTTVLLSLEDLVGDVGADRVPGIAAAAQGSIRRAADLMADDALEVRVAVDAILSSLPDYDATDGLALAERVSGRDGADNFSRMVDYILDWLHGRVRSGAAVADPRLARWAELWEKTVRAAREAEIYNLDRRPIVLAILSDLAAATRG